MPITVEDLLKIEEIKNLRLAYSAYFDTNNLDALADLFCEDAVCDFGPEWGSWTGRETIRTSYAAAMKQTGTVFDSLHVVTNPWITLTGPTTAHGRWYLLDLLTRQKPLTELATRGGHDNPLLYLAIYEDDYRKVGDTWKFAHCQLHFLWPERTFKALKHS